MFIFAIIFFVLNLLATCGYSSILRLTSDRRLHTYWILSTILFFIIFFTVPSIMVSLIKFVIVYEVLGFILYLGQCRKYLKNKNIERESW